ncbi:hypothetical protein SAMN05421676_1052 [Salinibacillus kushneri]|uniref:Uncharacterized protein n=1 Tax=Salinibacillus kushneri TaxID=237682 RepID=A0A1I0EP15_9BACI|nr:hypothetical protein [Salinibacillus kushneri]SET46486.1 hypothetical protein SAMN05421676_1052 [Salinibacillus kushneri]
MFTYMKWGLSISISLYALLHFITYFYESEFLLHVEALSGFFLLLFAAFLLSLNKFKLPLFLVSLGILIFVLSDTSIIEGFRNGLILMRDIIGLLVIIPMISWVLNTEPYIESIMYSSYRFINTSRKMYIGIASFTQVIAYFLLFGSIPMMYQFVNKMVGNQHGEPLERFKGTALVRSFALSTIWVVTIPSFIFAVEALDASLWLSILQGLFISVCGLVIAVLFSHFEEKKYGVDLTQIINQEMKKVLSDSSDFEQGNKAGEFLFLFITLFGTIFVLHEFWPIDLMVIVPLVVVVWTFVYFIVKKRTGKLVQEMKTYFRKGMVNQSYQFSVMLGAGMMIFSLNQTGFANVIISGVDIIQEGLPSLNFLYFLPFIVIILGFLGLGPLTVMVLVAGILQNIDLPYPPELIVMAITSGSVISILLSPLLMPIIILSGQNGMSGFKNGIQFNLFFAIVFYILVQVYIQSLIVIWLE